jgi:hypothetical protein
MFCLLLLPAAHRCAETRPQCRGCAVQWLTSDLHRRVDRKQRPALLHARRPGPWHDRCLLDLESLPLPKAAGAGMGSSALDDGSLLAQSVPLESEHPRARAPGRTEEADRGGGPRRRTEEADRGGGPRRRTEGCLPLADRQPMSRGTDGSSPEPLAQSGLFLFSARKEGSTWPAGPAFHCSSWRRGWASLQFRHEVRRVDGRRTIGSSSRARS